MPRFCDESRQEEERKCEILNRDLFNKLYYHSLSLSNTEGANEHEVLMAKPPVDENLIAINEISEGEDFWHYITNSSFEKLVEAFGPLLLESVQDGLNEKLLFKTFQIEIRNYKWMRTRLEYRLCVFDKSFVQFILLSSHDVLQLKFYIDFNFNQLRGNSIKYWETSCSCRNPCWVIEKRNRVSPGREYAVAHDEVPIQRQRFTVDFDTQGNFYKALKDHIHEHKCVCDQCLQLVTLYQPIRG